MRREFEAEDRRRINRERRDIAVAWYVAALTRQEKLRSLRDTLAPLEWRRKGLRVQTPSEQRKALLRIAEMNNLTVRVKES